MWSAQPSLPISLVAASFSERSGVGAFWLNLTAPPRPDGFLSLSERERIRKAELTSYSILAVFLFLLTLVSDTITQPSARFAIIAMAIGLCIAAALNRAGWTRLAAYLVPSLLMVLIMVAMLMAPGGLSLPWLPTYDLFAVPIFLSSIILDRRAPWFLAPIGIAFITLAVLSTSCPACYDTQQNGWRPPAFAYSLPLEEKWCPTADCLPWMIPGPLKRSPNSLSRLTVSALPIRWNRSTKNRMPNAQLSGY